MEVSNVLKKEMILEIMVLLLMASVIIYVYFTIDKTSHSNVTSKDGFVLVLEKTKDNHLEILSDGEGLENSYIRYTITNNNEVVKNVKLIIVPKVDNEEVLNYVRVGINNMMVNNLVELEKNDKGFIVDQFMISPGYTRNYLFKYWFSLGTDKKYIKEEIDFEYEIIIEDVE